MYSRNIKPVCGNISFLFKMFIRNFIFSCVIYIQMIEVIYGMSVENDYERSFYDLDDRRLDRSRLRDLDDMKGDIEQLKQQIADAKVKDQPMFDIRYDTLPEKCRTQGVHSNCAEATFCTKRSGVYEIKISQFSNDTFLVECNAHHMGGGWTVIQRRQDGSINFHRTWPEYKSGFGKIDGEFFIGLDKMHALTNYDGPQELLVLMENGTNSIEAYASYSAFVIGDESEKYILKQTGRFKGTAGDSLKRHIGHKFSTKDQDNDVYVGNCAEIYMGAWWYDKCHSSNLNGHYGDVEYAKGITWLSFTGYHNSLQYAQMMVRRRTN